MNSKHIIQLDGLRFIGILSVMIAHWLQWQWDNTILTKIPFTHGVTLFFVLSGFLISRILFINKDEYEVHKKNKSLLIKRFYIRRFLRIFPIYYLFIIGLFLINYQNTRELFPWLSTFTLNLHQSNHGLDVGNFNHFWSLAVEEQFYLLWPLLILYTKRSHTFLVITLVIALSLITRFYLYNTGSHWTVIAYSTYSNMDALGLGAILAYITRYQKGFIKSLARPIWIYLGLAAYLGLFIIGEKLNLRWYFLIFDPFIFSVISMLVILRASMNGFRSTIKYFLENKFIVYSGKVSYGMYVFHLFIPGFVYWLLPDTAFFNSYHPSSKYILFVAYYLLTFILAHFSWKVIEGPMNNLKHKYPYSNTKEVHKT